MTTKVYIRGRYCGESTVEYEMASSGYLVSVRINDLPEALLVADRADAVAGDRAFLADKAAPPGTNGAGWSAALEAVAQQGALSEVGFVNLRAAFAAYERAR